MSTNSTTPALPPSRNSLALLALTIFGNAMTYLSALRGPGTDTLVLTMAILTSICIPAIAALHLRNYRRTKAFRG